MPDVTTEEFFGGAGLSTNKLATLLRAMIDDIGNQMSEPAWTAELTVTTHVVTLAAAGWVVGVDATTATAAGGKTMQSAASPAAGFVQVAYTAGVATLTFNATDNVTGAKVAMIPYAAATATKG